MTRASRQLQHRITGFVAAVRSLRGAAISAEVRTVVRDELAALREKLNELAEDVERDRERINQLAAQTARSTQNVERVQAAAREAITDSLTGLSNRRAFDDALAGEIERVKRHPADLALVLIDLDNFKRINDTYGHPQGDQVLREVARVLRQDSREIDHPARYGGEELAVILPGTNLDGAFNQAERIREQISQLRIPRLDGSGFMTVTASCGVAASPPTAADAWALVKAADDALLDAKRRGDDDPDGAADSDGDVAPDEDDDADSGGVREPRRPKPNRGAGGAALPRPDAPDDPKPADAR